MKNVFKIWALSLALIASLILLGQTNAANVQGSVTFNITWVTNTACTYGTAWNAGTINASLLAQSTTGSLSTFSCTDTQGLSAWNMTLLANSAVSNGTTSIAATNVSMKASAQTIPSGDCDTWANTSTFTSIGSVAWTILAKASAVNEVCTISVATVEVAVAVPAAATIGSYSGTLLLTTPW